MSLNRRSKVANFKSPQEKQKETRNYINSANANELYRKYMKCKDPIKKQELYLEWVCSLPNKPKQKKKKAWK